MSVCILFSTETPFTSTISSPTLRPARAAADPETGEQVQSARMNELNVVTEKRDDFVRIGDKKNDKS